MVNSIRFSGIASGMDTQSIVDSLMQANRIPLNKIYQKKQLLEWKRDDYRNVNLMLNELDNFIFNGIYKKSNLTKKSVTSSNSEFVSAVASADAPNVSYQIDKVQLATAARKQSTNSISSFADNKLDPTKSLWSEQNKFGDGISWQRELVSDSFTVSKDGQTEFRLSKGAFSLETQNEQGQYQNIDTITVGSKTFTVTTDISELDQDKVFIDESTGKIKFGSGLEKGETFEVNYTNHFIDFEVKTYNENGEAQYTYIKIDGDSSLNNMFTTINRANAGVSMFYDSGTDKVVAMRSETGNFNPDGDEIEFLSVARDANGNIMRDVNGDILRDEENEQKSSFFQDVLGLGADIEGTGTDASFRINGLETTRKSNTFTLNGVTFTLKKDSYVDGVNLGDTATISTNTDTDSIVETITDFVNKYNEMIDKINGKLSEERYKSFAPLTDEEKSALSDKEIERWEEKAKSGMLRRDMTLSNAIDKMRVNLYSEVVSNDVTKTNPNYNQLTEIGITTSKNYSDRGKLEINEDKLRAAIEDDPEAIYQLFMADGESSSEQGLARRLRDTIQSTVKSIEERAGNTYRTAQSYTMGKQIKDYEDQIYQFEKRLVAMEQRYWNQFNAMEKAMQNLNNQSNMLYSYLGLGAQQ